MRFFLEIILSIVVVWQYTTIRNYQLEIEQLSGELNFLLDNQRGLLLLRTNSKTIQKLILSINDYLQMLYQKKADFQKMKTELHEMMINLSHDLKTPLTTLSGYVQLLQIRYNEDHNNYQSIDAILEKLQTKTAQTNRMITQFLDIAKIESGDIEIEFLQIDIGRLCKELVMEYYDISSYQEGTVNSWINDGRTAAVVEFDEKYQISFLCEGINSIEFQDFRLGLPLDKKIQF